MNDIYKLAQCQQMLNLSRKEGGT